MNDTVASLFTLFLWLLILAVFLRSLLSWFPISQENEAARLLYRITEPLLEPVRRVLPRTGIIDFSGMVVIILLYVMIEVVRRAAAQ
ncbi:YggT family protein [Tepidiforma thermophila]|uniref:YggT family protein n=1 Tax=Tepidiforma thermophila (strain KCTC 52669 / CGMCC 1.13589 / G233) TaxID=2761530 RepID=UPI000BFA9B24|nr:YggT family protein [Tepidiforma thermophila]